MDPARPTFPLGQVLQSASDAHRAGRAAEAEGLYRQVLAVDPDQVEALHGLGVLHGRAGRFDAAIALLRRAVARRPGDSALHGDLAHALRGAGRVAEALAADREAVRLGPERAAAHEGLGLSLHRAGQPAEAVVHFRRAVALSPESPVALCNLGAILHEQGKSDEAVTALRQAVRLRPAYGEALYHLGQVLRDQGRIEEAVTSLRQAAQLRPEVVAVHNLLGNALRDLGQLPEAIGHYEAALRLQPNQPALHINLGLACEDAKQFDRALACYDRAIQLRPDDADAHTYRAMLLLRRGDFERGWAEYEWRWQVRRAFARPAFDRPAWEGSDLRGQTILLYGEQGLGDTLQFVRYASLLAARGATVIVECQPELKRLLDNVAGTSTVIARGEPRPAFDCHQALLSLPRLFQTTLASVPAEIPYVKVDPDAIAAWRDRLGPKEGVRVGLVWAGRPTHKNDRNRSINLDVLGPLAELSGVRFYSLQLGPAARQLTRPPAGLRVVDLTGNIRDFVDTAALIENLDLVVTVDTSVAHLAGMLGRPVWVLLPYAADWRWLEDRDDTPWYPTMRLFRQPAHGDWDSVVRRVAAELTRFPPAPISVGL